VGRSPKWESKLSFWLFLRRRRKPASDHSSIGDRTRPSSFPIWHLNSINSLFDRDQGFFSATDTMAQVPDQVIVRDPQLL
jgi:hypothetical protein